MNLYSLTMCRRWFGEGHDDLVGRVRETLVHAFAGNSTPLILSLEGLRQLDVPKQTAFLQSLLGAYRDAKREAEADGVIAELIEQNDSTTIRLRIGQTPQPRENRALHQRLADANQLNGAEAWTLANYWASGEAGPREAAVATRLKALALDKEYPMACYEEALRLGKLPANQVDARKYRRLLEISWNHGYREIARPLYNLVSTGQGGPKDTKAAATYLLKAAKYNDPLANLFVGIYYAKGIEGFPRNPSAAIPYLQKGIAAGYPEPAALLGEIYLYGRAGSTNLREAYNQFNRAQAAGYWRSTSNPVVPESVIAALTRQVSCETCKGAGKHTGYRTCRDCRGRGSYRCDKCNGSGTTKKYRHTSCASCRGSGYVRFGYDSKGDNRARDYKSATVCCTTCNGRGNWSVADNVRCRSCGGDGDRRCSRCSGKGDIQTSGPCSPCGGNGKIIRYDSPKSFSSSEL